MFNVVLMKVHRASEAGAAGLVEGEVKQRREEQRTALDDGKKLEKTLGPDQWVYVLGEEPARICAILDPHRVEPANRPRRAIGVIGEF